MTRKTPIVSLLCLSAQLLFGAGEPASTPVAKLRQEHTGAKRAAAVAVNKSFVTQTEKLFLAFDAAKDTKNARRAEDFFKRLRDGSSTNDFDEIEDAPAADDKLGQLQAKFVKERAEALRKVNGTFVDKIKAASLPVEGPNGLSEAAYFLHELAPDGVVSDGTRKGTTTTLLNPLNAPKWKIESGEWETKGNTLIGKGVSDQVYIEDQPLPFTLKFTIKVVAGMRPRVKVGDVTFANEGYTKTMYIYPHDKGGTPFAYELNQEYKITIAVSSKAVEFSVDDKLIATAPGMKRPVDKFRFSGGDNWSKGTVEYRDIVVVR